MTAHHRPMPTPETPIGQAIRQRVDRSPDPEDGSEALGFWDGARGHPPHRAERFRRGGFGSIRAYRRGYRDGLAWARRQPC